MLIFTGIDHPALAVRDVDALGGLVLPTPGVHLLLPPRKTRLDAPGPGWHLARNHAHRRHAPPYPHHLDARLVAPGAAGQGSRRGRSATRRRRGTLGRPCRGGHRRRSGANVFRPGRQHAATRRAPFPARGSLITPESAATSPAPAFETARVARPALFAGCRFRPGWPSAGPDRGKLQEGCGGGRKCGPVRRKPR